MLLQVLFKVEGLATSWLGATERLLVDMLVLLVVLRMGDETRQKDGCLHRETDLSWVGRQAPLPPLFPYHSSVIVWATTLPMP